MCRPAVGCTRASSRGPAGRHGPGQCSCAPRTRRPRWYEVRFRLLRDRVRVGALGAPDEVDVHHKDPRTKGPGQPHLTLPPRGRLTGASRRSSPSRTGYLQGLLMAHGVESYPVTSATRPCLCPADWVRLSAGLRARRPLRSGSATRRYGLSRSLPKGRTSAGMVAQTLAMPVSHFRGPSQQVCPNVRCHTGSPAGQSLGVRSIHWQRPGLHRGPHAPTECSFHPQGGRPCADLPGSEIVTEASCPPLPGASRRWAFHVGRQWQRRAGGVLCRCELPRRQRYG